MTQFPHVATILCAVPLCPFSKCQLMSGYEDTEVAKEGDFEVLAANLNEILIKHESSTHYFALICKFFEVLLSDPDVPASVCRDMAKALDAISNAKLEEEKKKSANGPKRPKEKHMKDVDELDEETYRKDFEEETNTLKQQLAVQAVFDDAELEKRCQEDAKVEAEERRKEHEILEQQRKKEQDRANYRTRAAGENETKSQRGGPGRPIRQRARRDETRRRRRMGQRCETER